MPSTRHERRHLRGKKVIDFFFFFFDFEHTEEAYEKMREYLDYIIENAPQIMSALSDEQRDLLNTKSACVKKLIELHSKM